MTDLRLAFATGYECLAAWADLLDRINVFPVADGDTGTNLRISLAPLRDVGGDPVRVAEALGRSATGNSGNIAAAFFCEMVGAAGAATLSEQAAAGRDRAWQAVALPRQGTMLSVFDALPPLLAGHDRPDFHQRLVVALQDVVTAGVPLIAELEQAGVVDAGALAMFVFFDGFCQHLVGREPVFVDLPLYFPDRLVIADGFQHEVVGQFCVDALLAVREISPSRREALTALGDSVVLRTDNDRLKLHLHTEEPERLRRHLAEFGELLDWRDEPIGGTPAPAFAADRPAAAIHIMSDAAGSLPRAMADRYGITLLDSYVVVDGASRPESLCEPQWIYALLRAGQKVTTAQASTAERHQHYRRACREMGKTLYLCVGSAFTGNVAVATTWQREHDPDQLLEVLDTGAASGRLGLLALLTARYARQTSSPEQVLAYARRLCETCREYVFIDELKYLVAGGRVSKAGGFFGDLLHLKPVISPTAAGVRKQGVVRSSAAQLAFARRRLKALFGEQDRPAVLLQFSDNEAWVTDTVLPALRQVVAEAEFLVVPLSLTSGVHMGPGTWAMAVAPQE